MVDPESVTNRLARLRPLLSVLEEIRARGRDNYLSDRRTRLEAERALQLSLQICIDVGAHLSSELGLPPPGDYRGVFASLRDVGLDGELAARLMDATGTRNVLVHDYLELDNERIWGALGKLDDLRDFAAWSEQLAARSD